MKLKDPHLLYALAVLFQILALPSDRSQIFGIRHCVFHMLFGLSMAFAEILSYKETRFKCHIAGTVISFLWAAASLIFLFKFN